MKPLTVIKALFLLPFLSSAQDKSIYSLANPTPDNALRELSPDRPDATESPITVDAGRFAVEVSYFDWGRDGGDDTYTILATNFKVGINHRTDLQFVFDSLVLERPEDGTEQTDFGDVQIRLKYNLFGNDSDGPALALFPFVTIPTDTAVSSGEWEGGLIVPFAMPLTDGIGLGLMAEFDAVYDDDQDRHEFEFLHSAVLGIDLTEQLGAFVEYIGIAGEASYEAYFSGGFTYGISENLVLDWGTTIGLNDAADDLAVFGGFTKRF
ncbi:MAG: transporter [Verrucomicrobiota bacterium]